MTAGADSKGALLLVAMLLAACPGKGSSTPRRDAGDAGAVADPATLADASATTTDDPGDGGGDGGASAAGTGSLTIKVLWPTAPAAVRASPGYTSCHTPRRARARIGTLHGVAGAMVVLDGIAAGKPAAGAKPLRLTMRDCSIDPVANVARLGASLEIQTQDVAHAVSVVRVGKPWLEDDIKLAPVTLARTSLPVIGHTVAVALDEPGALQVAMDGAVDDAAWVLVPPHRFAGVTDDVGALGMRDVPPGSYSLVAWLPPAAGFPEQRAVASVTVKAGADTEATITFAPAAP